jgi:hypothetical protein
MTTIYEPWNHEKIATLKAQGYKVIVLYERAEKKVSGARIREDIHAGGRDWRKLVPPATARAVDSLGLGERLRQLTSD